MLLARTDPDVPKHQGITYFGLDMHQDGIEIRPLRELTGRAMFNEVFMTDAVAEDAAAIGGVNNGWAVANTTLMFERAGLGAGGSGGGGTGAAAGSVAGDLDKRAGDFARPPSGARQARTGLATTSDQLVKLAQENGMIADANVRQGIAQLDSLNEIARYTNLRTRALRSQGKEIPGAGNMAKLSMSRILRLSRDLGLRIVGASGTLHAYTSEQRAALDEATGNPLLALVTGQALYAQAPPIYGGTDQIQRNIIGERALGLPREPGHDKNTPFSELPKNG
jgi:alkylation response protein AidB-like acyl-CoA dehydrogenase